MHDLVADGRPFEFNASLKDFQNYCKRLATNRVTSSRSRKSSRRPPSRSPRSSLLARDGGFCISGRERSVAQVQLRSRVSSGRTPPKWPVSASTRASTSTGGTTTSSMETRATPPVPVRRLSRTTCAGCRAAPRTSKHLVTRRHVWYSAGRRNR